MTKMTKPDFICIAPHKTATTWLHEVLGVHPQVWLPPKKELWVLNQLRYPYRQRWGAFLTRSGMQGDIRRSFERDWHARLRHNLLDSDNLQTLAWWAKYIVLPYSLRNYDRLFPHHPNKVCGDITPNYYFLKQDVVQNLAMLIPDLKVILILRNPIDRVWSYTRMTFPQQKGKKLDEAAAEELIQYFDQLHSWWVPYVQTLERWKSRFRNVGVFYFDDLENSPASFFHDICDFLGVQPDFVPAQLNFAVNQGVTVQLPTFLRHYLAMQYLPEIRELVGSSDNLAPANWLHELETLAG